MTEETPKRTRRRAKPVDDAPSEPATPMSAGPNDRESVDVDELNVQQGRIGTATARAVTVRQGAIGRVTAENVLLTQGAIGGARTRQLSVELGALGGAIAGEARVRQSYVQGILARDVSLEQAGARTVIANHVTMGRQSGALVVIARTVEGDGRALLDWRGALALGAAVAVVSALLRGRRRWPR